MELTFATGLESEEKAILPALYAEIAMKDMLDSCQVKISSDAEV